MPINCRPLASKFAPVALVSARQVAGNKRPILLRCGLATAADRLRADFAPEKIMLGVIMPGFRLIDEVKLPGPVIGWAFPMPAARARQPTTQTSIRRRNLFGRGANGSGPDSTTSQ